MLGTSGKTSSAQMLLIWQTLSACQRARGCAPAAPMPSTMSRVRRKGTSSGVFRKRPCSNAIPRSMWTTCIISPRTPVKAPGRELSSLQYSALHLMLHARSAHAAALLHTYTSANLEDASMVWICQTVHQGMLVLCMLQHPICLMHNRQAAVVPTAAAADASNSTAPAA